jgi:hypothetical protein
MRYEVLSGDLLGMRSSGLEGSATCLDAGLAQPAYDDARPVPGPGAGFYYMVRGHNPCGVGPAGPGREALDGLECPQR